MKVENVIDVGCAAYGGAESIPYLIEEFQPRFLLGLDPAAANDCYELGDTLVCTFRAAAWTYYGQIGYIGSGTTAYVSEDGSASLDVPAFDLARLVRAFGPSLAVKMDCEGAEYPLIRHLLDQDVDDQIKLLWVEWHKPPDDPAELPDLGRLRCETAPWNR